MRVLLSSILLLPLAVPSFAFEPGTLGDHYRDFGHVQGCTDAGELPGCTLIAGGSQFVVPEGGQTPAEVMAALKALPPLSYVEFRGDILNVYDSYAEMALGAVALAEPGQDSYGDLIASMQGNWVSTEDAEAKLHIDGLIWADVYGADQVAQSVMSFGTECSDGTPADAPVLELFTIGPMDSGSLCYADLSVEGDTLQVTYLGAGNTLTFTRAK